MPACSGLHLGLAPRHRHFHETIVAVNREGYDARGISIAWLSRYRRKNYQENWNNASVVSTSFDSICWLWANRLVFLSMECKVYGMGLPFDEQEQEVPRDPRRRNKNILWRCNSILRNKHATQHDGPRVRESKIASGFSLSIRSSGYFCGPLSILMAQGRRAMINEWKQIAHSWYQSLRNLLSLSWIIWF